MARKRPIENPPPASSSEEDEEEEEEEESFQENSSGEDADEPQTDAVQEEEEDDDDDDDDNEAEEKTPLPKSKTGSGKVGSDSEYDSDKSLPSPSVSDFTIKPIVKKPTKSCTKSTPKPKPVATEASSKQKKPSSSVSNGSGATVKTPGTARLWSEADEIAILEGMINYKKKGSDPYADASGFHEFIKQSIQADVSKYQLTEKIRRLKKKYKTNAEKGQNGNDPVFSKPHDQKSFELSKKIWGNETNEKSNKGQKKRKTSGSEDDCKNEVNGWVTLGLPCVVKDKEVSAVKDKEVSADISDQVSSDSEEEMANFWDDYPFLKESFETDGWGHAGGFLKELVEKIYVEIGEEKMKKMEKACKDIKMKELELYLERLDLVQEMAQAVLKALKGSEN